MLRPAADHRVHQDYISDHLELTGERKEEEEEDIVPSHFHKPNGIFVSINTNMKRDSGNGF